MNESYQSNLQSCARELRKRQTKAEQILWGEVRNRKFFGYKFVRQRVLLTYIADFYCSELRLIIEIDGGYHEQQMEFDAGRSSELKAYGKAIIRFTNNEIEYHLKDSLDRLKCCIDDLNSAHTS